MPIPVLSPPVTAWWNKIDRKTVDLVLCQAGTLRPLVAIELDDSTHRRERRRARDAEVEAILGGAGLPLLRWRCDPGGYEGEELAAALAHDLGKW